MRGALRGAQRALRGEEEVHLRRRFGAWRDLEGGLDAVDGEPLTGFGDILGGWDQADRASRGRLAEPSADLAGGAFVDAGWDGFLTLELSNVANLPITLYPGMKIGQLSFIAMTTSADRPYGSAQLGSKYQGQRGPTPSRYWENFKR